MLLLNLCATRVSPVILFQLISKENAEYPLAFLICTLSHLWSNKIDLSFGCSDSSAQISCRKFM